MFAVRCPIHGVHLPFALCVRFGSNQMRAAGPAVPRRHYALGSVNGAELRGSQNQDRPRGRGNYSWDLQAEERSRHQYVPVSRPEMFYHGKCLLVEAQENLFRGTARGAQKNRMSFCERLDSKTFNHIPLMTQFESDCVGRLVTMFFLAMEPVLKIMRPLPRRARSQQELGAWIMIGSTRS